MPSFIYLTSYILHLPSLVSLLSVLTVSEQTAIPLYIGVLSVWQSLTQKFQVYCNFSGKDTKFNHCFCNCFAIFLAFIFVFTIIICIFVNQRNMSIRGTVCPFDCIVFGHKWSKLCKRLRTIFSPFRYIIENNALLLQQKTELI